MASDLDYDQTIDSRSSRYRFRESCLRPYTSLVASGLVVRLYDIKCVQDKILYLKPLLRLSLRTGYDLQRRRGLRKLEGKELNFLIHIYRCEVSTEEIMYAQTSNFAPKFPRTSVIASPIFCIFGRK